MALYLFSIVFPWMFERGNLLMSKWRWSESSDHKYKIWKTANKIESLIKVLKFAQLIASLHAGSFQTIAERAAGLKLSTVSATRISNPDFDILNEHLVWNAIADFLVFIRPIIRANRHLLKFGGEARKIDPAIQQLPDHLCSFCYLRGEDVQEICQRSRIGCGHEFCYYCAADAKRNESLCPKCNSLVTSVELVRHS